MKRSILFSGQSSQYVGMGSDYFKNNPTFRDYFKVAQKQLDFDIQDIMLNGPLDKLSQTQYTQPCIFVYSIALLYIYKPDVSVFAGHSLGEFSALVAAGIISFEDGLNIVSTRGKAMHEANNKQPGTMAAIVGLDANTLNSICNELSQDAATLVVPANYNSDEQIVISGTINGVEKAIQHCKEQGAKFTKRLDVGGAFHSPLMQSAKDTLKKVIESTHFYPPRYPIYTNYKACATLDVDEIKHNCIEQLTTPVRWSEIIQNMYADGIEQYTEMGPRNILQRLVSRIISEKVYTNGYY